MVSKSQREAAFAEAQEQRRRCTDWLKPQMTEGKPKAFTKDEYRQLAIAALGVSSSVFDAAWVWSIEETGRHDWYNPLPRKKVAKH